MTDGMTWPWPLLYQNDGLQHPTMRSLCTRSCRLRTYIEKFATKSMCNPNSSHASSLIEPTRQTGNDYATNHTSPLKDQTKINTSAAYLQLFCCRCARRIWHSWSCRSQPKAWSPRNETRSYAATVFPRDMAVNNTAGHALCT